MAYEAFEGANGWYVAFKREDGFHRQPAGAGTTERASRREAQEGNDRAARDAEDGRAPRTTSDGGQIIGYGTYGAVRGYGPLRATLDQARRDAERDARGCERQHGYSDRDVVAVDEDGCCWSEDGNRWIPGPGGRTNGAARYSMDDVRGSLRDQVASGLAAEVAAIVGHDDGTGDIGIITRQALIDDPSSTAEDIAEIVREARVDAKADRPSEVA